MISQPLICNNGQIQRSGPYVVQPLRFALSEPEPLVVSGDFTMTHSVHELITTGWWKTVNNIYGAEPGEILFLFGNRIRLRNNGNINLTSTFRLRSGRSILLYYTGLYWIVMSKTT